MPRKTVYSPVQTWWLGVADFSHYPWAKYQGAKQGAEQSVASVFVKQILLNSETYIKNFAARWADKKPFSDIALPFEHGVKTIFVSTRWTNLKLVF
jgi:hypothetical protein